MKKKAILVTLEVVPRTVPLVSGYLKGYAYLSPQVKRKWTFEFYNRDHLTSPSELASELKKTDADVYGFSCYVWNMGLVKEVVSSLLKWNPELHIILGGPQVMNHADRYLLPQNDNLVLCNGEGERTFRAYLEELDKEEPDFSQVKGISFWKGNKLVTTGSERRITNLDEIPSPYLNGAFENGDFQIALLETTRGCPFKCLYCFWGAAVGSSTYKMNSKRIKSELDWIAHSGIYFLMLCDANWGMYKRDIDLSIHLAACKKQYGYPMGVYSSMSKTKPRQVSKIAEIFHNANIRHSQGISLQTLNASALKKINRKNIKPDDYLFIQEYLNTHRIDSNIELIWPLPGETLNSFRHGIHRLCETGAKLFRFFPLLLMNNIGLNDHREEYGLIVEKSSEPNSEADVVVQTKLIDKETCLEGWRFAHATHALFNLRSLFHTARYLNLSYIIGYEALFLRFVDFLKSNTDSPLSSFIETEIRTIRVNDVGFALTTYGICQEYRERFDSFLFEFASSQFWWNDEVARLFFEIDLLSRPYIYSDQIQEKKIPFQALRVLDVTDFGYVIEIPGTFFDRFKDIMAPATELIDFESNIIEIDHNRFQEPLDESTPIMKRCYESFEKILSIAQITPILRACHTWTERGRVQRGGVVD